MKGIYLLSDHHKLDKAFELFRMHYRQNKWDEAEQVADYMHDLAHSLYQEQLQQSADGMNFTLQTKRPLVFYYAYSYLGKAIVYQEKRLFDQAREYIIKYAEMGWFNGLDNEGIEEVERFRFFAKANLFAVDLLSGKKEALEEYVHFIRENGEELLPGLIVITEAANLHHWDVTHILNEFSQQFDEFSSYEDMGNRVYYTKLLYQLVVYYFKQNRYTIALNYILEYLTFSSSMEADNGLKVVMALFEEYRAFASDEQQNQFKTIIKGVLSNEKNDHFSCYGVNVS